MVTIRPATAADVPRIVELVDGMTITSSTLQEGRQPTPQTYLDAFAEIEAAPGITTLVAETVVPAGEEAFPVTSTDGNAQTNGDTSLLPLVVVGTVVLLVVPSLSHGGLPWAKVEHMVVAEHLRGRGIGRQIMEYAIDRARQAGCYRIELTSDNRRPEAHRFYSSLGFEAAATGFRRYF